MSDQIRDDRFWWEMADEMQRALLLHELTSDEAAEEYIRAPKVPVSDEDIEEFLMLAKSRVLREGSYNERVATVPGFADIDEEVGEVLAIHRNEGTMDAEVEEEMRRKRNEVLRQGNYHRDEHGPEA